jgi:serine/threonine-protein kinase
MKPGAGGDLSSTRGPPAALELPEGAPKVGAIFAEKYRIERLIGTGGMGYVLAAHHLKLDERVAIKLLLPDEASRKESAERFLREARSSV